MHLLRQIRSLVFSRAADGRGGRWVLGAGKKLAALAGLAAGLGSAQAQTASTYTITAVSPASIPAGAAGATLGLAGTLPDFGQTPFQVCFYTGAGSGAALTPTNVGGVQTITVPAGAIQGIDPSSFTAANGYAVSALVSVVQSGQTCDGTFDATLTNSFPVAVVEPTLVAYAGPLLLPQANTAAGVQAAPTAITLSGANFVAGTTVTFGTFGQVTPRTITPTALTVMVPAGFSSSTPTTTATLSVCNGGGATTAFCSTSATPITLTVSALASSSGTITATPSAVLTSAQTTLSSTFTPSASNPVGSPSGTVTFVADGQTLAPAAKLILDKTAEFTPVTSSLTIPKAAAPVITPASGSYLNSTTVTISDTTAGAAIYYTTDGSTPTSGSTLYAGPFSITTSETIMAIAALSGSLNSAPASAAYTITVSPPTQLVFQTQPANTSINTSIAPAVQVAIEDANGNVVTSSTLAVTLSLITNPAEGTLAGTLTVNAVNGIATFPDLSINNVGTGYAIHAVSGRLTPAVSAAFNITPYPITLSVQSQLIGIGSTLTGTFTLGHAAPTGGLTVTLASSATGNVTIAPSTVTVAAGQTTGNFTYTGVAAGDANLTASATNYQTGTTTVTGTAAQVSLDTIPAVAPGQTVSLALSLPMAAPPGGTTVTFTSSNTAIATVTSSIFVPAGAQTASANPQVVGVKIGSATILASAPGFAPAARPVTVTVISRFNPTSISINLTTTTSTTLNISAPAQTGGLTFTLTSDDPTIASVPATISMVQGTTSVQVPITGVANGTTTIRANSPGVAETTLTVTVNSTISASGTYTAYHLQSYYDFYLPVTPQTPTTVTFTLPDTTVALLTSSITSVGTKTVTFNNVTSSYIGRVYLQGVTTGTTTLSISAPGYTTGSGTLTVYASGISFYGGSSDFNTTTFDAARTVNASTVVLVPSTLFVYTYGLPIAPGVAPVSIPVTDSMTSVGTITPTTLVFTPGNSYVGTSFTPAGAGTATLTLGTASGGFSTPSQTQFQHITATVSAPQISFGGTATGENLQTYYDLYLPIAPPSTQTTPETVTVTIGAPGNAVISKDQATGGSGTLTFSVSNTTYIGRIWLQGLASGSTTLTISAPGYSAGSNTLTVYKSGFTFYAASNDFTTTTFSGPTTVRVGTVLLVPGSLNIYTYGYSLNPGVTASVPLTNSNTAAGTIATSVVFHGGDSIQSTNFTPAGAGSTTIKVGAAPTGFVTPSQSQYQQIVATVTAPVLSVGNLNVAPNLQDYLYVNVPQVPTGGTTITVTSSNPAMALISTGPMVAGSASLSFNVTTPQNFVVYVQGQSTGTSTITATGTGYTTGMGTATVGLSGFSFYAGTNDFTTTTFSSTTTIGVRTLVLDATTKNIVTYGLGLNPGVTVAVPLTDSRPEVGTLAAPMVIFKPNEGYESTTFKPLSAGSTTLGVVTPAGYTTTAQTQFQQVNVTVTAPQISVDSITTGVNLEGNINVYLPVAPPGPVDVLVTSNGPAISTISNDPAVVGGTTLLFPGITQAGYIGTIYVQGQKVGSTTITAAAAGYTNGVGTATVYPSGFAFYGGTGDFTTTTTSTPPTVTVRTVVLNLGTLTIENYGFLLNPGLGSITVPLTSGTTSVGTVSGPFVFTAGQSAAQTTFTPLSAGSSVLTLGTPTNATATDTGFSPPSQYTSITATVSQ